MYIDVFNGDADGIFSLIQLRKMNPVLPEQQLLVTGVKRDISLLKRINKLDVTNANITVLDVSFDKNSKELETLLSYVDSVFYCDHHQARTLFQHERLTCLIDTAPTVCTALLVNAHLNNAQPLWAITAAYGDGLDKSASQLADQFGVSDEKKLQLKQLGELVNYNGYGASVDDLHYRPEALYQELMKYDDPFEVVSDRTSPFALLKAGYESDLASARETKPLINSAIVTAVQLPTASWAARISGSYGNILAAESPDKAVVIASSNADSTLTISLRAPKNKPYGAADICSQFDTGGGREGAAGINALGRDRLADFLRFVEARYM